MTRLIKNVHRKSLNSNASRNIGGIYHSNISYYEPLATIIQLVRN